MKAQTLEQKRKHAAIIQEIIDERKARGEEVPKELFDVLLKYHFEILIKEQDDPIKVRPINQKPTREDWLFFACLLLLPATIFLIGLTVGVPGAGRGIFF